MAWQIALETTNLDPQLGSSTIRDADDGTTGPAHVTSSVGILALGGSGTGSAGQRGFPVSG